MGEHGIGEHGIGAYGIGENGIGEHGTREYGIGENLRQLPPNNLNHSVHHSGSTPEAAAELKMKKYSTLATSHHFVPFAIETLGPICKTASDLISEISLRSSERSGEPRESAFLFQKLSIAVQRINCAALNNSFDLIEV